MVTPLHIAVCKLIQQVLIISCTLHNTLFYLRGLIRLIIILPNAKLFTICTLHNLSKIRTPCCVLSNASKLLKLMGGGECFGSLVDVEKVLE